MAINFKFEMKTASQQVQEYLYSTFMTLLCAKKENGFCYLRDEVYVQFRTCLDQCQIQFPIDDSYSPPTTSISSNLNKPFVFDEKNASSLECRLKKYFNTLYARCSNCELSAKIFYETFIAYLNVHKYKFPIQFNDQKTEFTDLCQLFVNTEINIDDFYQRSKSLFSD